MAERRGHLLEEPYLNKCYGRTMKKNEIRKIRDKPFFISHGPLHTDNSIVALAGARKRL